MTTFRPPFLSRHPLASYFILTFVISWVFATLMVLSSMGTLGPVSPFLHYAVLSGPILSALIVTTATDGLTGLARIARSLTNFRIGTKWLLMTFLSPILVLAIALVIVALSGSPLPSFGSIGRTTSLPGLGLVPTLIIMILAAVEEEVGWRGFALPRLQASRSALPATLLLSLVWFAWHLPMFWYRPTFATPTPVMFVGIFVGLAAGAIILTWLFNSTRGSLLAVSVWHGVWSAIAASDVGDLVPAVMSMLFVAWAIAIVAIYKPADLSRSKRVTELSAA